MADLIDRQSAIDAVDSETVITNPEHFKSNEKFIKFMDDSDISSFGKWQWANGFNTALVATRIHLKKLPSAQPERKRGHWIDMDSDLEKYDDIKCSCCKHEFTVDAYHWTDIGFIKDDLNFCPNCGADMRGESDE